MTNLAHNTTNDTRHDEFMAAVREFGRNDALGDDALPMLAIAFAQAIADGVEDPAKDQKGNDAAVRVFDVYCTSKGKKQVHERSAVSMKAQYSKLRQIQNAAAETKFDFVGVIQRAFTIRDQLIDDGQDVKPAYAAYVDLARDQLKQDDDLTDDQIEAIVRKGEKTKEKTVEGQLKKAQKILEDLITGEKDGLKDQSIEVLIAAEQLNTRLAALLTTQKQQDAIAAALEAGYVLNEDGSLRLAA